MARRFLPFLVLPLVFASAFSQPQSPRSVNAAELRLALKKLTVLGSVLYVAAHPDDDNTAFLGYMAKGRLMRSAYLSMTRGEGGQNLIGPEQGELLGVIRTQELLASRRIDGAEQYFTRAIDFGFSKTLDETMSFWGREKILSDAVWLIRSYRPDVVVTRFTPTQGGHGNHTASAELAYQAYAAAGDPGRFPDQLKYVQPWKPKRLVWNVFRFQQTDRPSVPEHSVSIDLGMYSTVLGESFTEMAGRSRSMNKSQGTGGGQNRGEFVNYFQHIAGDTATKDLFDGVNTAWSRVPGGAAVGTTLENVYRAYDEENPEKSIPALLRAYAELGKLKEDPWIALKKRDLQEAIRLSAGLWVDVLSSENNASPGSDIKLTVSAINRSSYPFRLERIVAPLLKADSALNVLLRNNQPLQAVFGIKIPLDFPYSQPYWLAEPSELGSYRVANQQYIGQPENAPQLVVKVRIASDDGAMELEVPVRFRMVDPVEGEQYRPFAVIPPVSVNLPEKVYVFPDGMAKTVMVNIRNEGGKISGSVALGVPQGWKVTPAGVPFEFSQKDENQSVSFSVQPGPGAGSGEFQVKASVGGRVVGQDVVTIRYPHIPLQTLFPLTAGRLLRFELKTISKRIGYIMGPGDEIPTALRQMGYPVTMLTDDDLKNGSLGLYDVIIAGVRSYNMRPVLRANQRKLMEFVEKGGTYIVQYMTPRRAETENLGPYPFSVTGDRVSVEDAPVRFLAERHPVLNMPNKITQEDFKGWIQERGLYFSDKWDSHYTPVLGSNDPGEPSRDGGLLVTQYGTGHYVFTGYAFFRQLPGGVAGAYRLFANLVALGK
ncbi:MAG: PIG-L family deacetylase [Ignavibacteriales bacterium]|nr:PIG-L family deacetylase [Ignavibacteriales bacterium]